MPKAQHDAGGPPLPESLIRTQTAHVEMTRALQDLVNEFSWSATIPRARVQSILEAHRYV
ncbi:hypothetical protein SEA_MRMIYAGI_112 [Mycobacterium phage MrMiyagi]|nr:hypothetical protein SEA_MRMIYAGI_112 [Mycobacterium phage MrMiyagi]